MSTKFFWVILTVLLLFSPSEILAQRYPKSEKEANLEAMTWQSGIYQKKSSIWRGSSKLSKEELSSMEGFNIDLYSKGRVKAGVGTALIALGAVPCVIGTVGLVGSIQEDDLGSGLPQMAMLLGYGTGILLEAVGIPLHCSGKADIRHAAVSYNGQLSIQYSIGPTTNGFGIALNF